MIALLLDLCYAREVNNSRIKFSINSADTIERKAESRRPSDDHASPCAYSRSNMSPSIQQDVDQAMPGGMLSAPLHKGDSRRGSFSPSLIGSLMTSLGPSSHVGHLRAD